MGLKLFLFMIACAFATSGCTTLDNRHFLRNAKVVAVGHTMHWVAPTNSEGLVIVVEGNTGKAILSKSITSTDRHYFFDAQFPDTMRIVQGVMGDVSVQNLEFKLY